MLFVAIIQSLAVAFTITALVKNTLMLSPEQHGVTCNITSSRFPKKHITAQHLVVYWGWSTLEVRWNFKGLSETQVWFKESYVRTYNFRCKGPINITTTPTPTVLQTHTQNISTSTTAKSRKLLQYESYPDKDSLISFEVPSSLQYNSVLTTHSFLPSMFLPLPPLQTTNTYGHKHVEYAYPFKITEIYPYDSNMYEYRNDTADVQLIPTKAPTPAPTDIGCNDLQIVIQTGKSYFSLLLCGLFCASLSAVLLIPPTCYLVNMNMRRRLKQIVIGVNTVGFMLLLMAFAIWFAYFSTNINQVIEEASTTEMSVCILGEPVFGDSIAYLLTGWLLIGFATMSVCYLGNRPKRWYRFIREQRHFNTTAHLNVNEPILEESQSDMDSDSSDDDDDDGYYDRMEHSDSDEENERLDTLMNRTPSNNSSGSNDTNMTADHSFGQVANKPEIYTVSYSPP